MKNLTIILCLIFLSGFGYSQTKFANDTVESIYNEFMLEAVYYDVEMNTFRIDSIFFDDKLIGFFLGLSVKENNSIRLNGILKDDCCKLKVVLYHELGHYHLDYEHDTTKEFSIMDSNLTNDKCNIIKNNWSHYKEKFFRRNQ